MGYMGYMEGMDGPRKLRQERHGSEKSESPVENQPHCFMRPFQSCRSYGAWRGGTDTAPTIDMALLTELTHYLRRGASRGNIRGRRLTR